LGAGAGFTWAAGLAGAACLLGALVFFWSPQASAEKSTRTKNTIDFFRIVLFGMSNLLMVFHSSGISSLLHFQKRSEIRNSTRLY
jgi:uncharacterized membrane protein YphA (DoxX/SURF4 family)